jgi:hypothetical protein
MALLAAVSVLLTLTACDDDNRWSTAPGAPTLRPSWGARETDGQLKIWTGSPCTNITKFSLGYNMGGAELTLTAMRPEGAHVEHLTLGGPYPGFTVSESWPAGTDWHSAKELVLQVDGRSADFGAGTRVAEIVDGSPEHPVDTYWFQGVGWLNPSDVAAKDGKEFAAVCTPNPPNTAS